MTQEPNRSQPRPPANDPDRGKRPKSGISTVMTVVIVVLAVMLVINMFGDQAGFMQQVREIEQNEFRELLYTGQIASIEQEGEIKLSGELKRDTGPGGPPERFAVEFPAGVLADRYDEISRMVSAEFGTVPLARFREGIDGGRIQLREAYTVATDSGIRLFAQYLGRSEDTQNAPLGLRYWEVETGSPGGIQAELDPTLSAIAAKFPKLELANVQASKPKALKATQPNTFLINLLYTLLPWVLLIVLFWFLIMRQMRSPGGTGGVLSFGRSRAQLITKEKSNVTFDDVAGIDEAKEEVQEIIEFLKNPARFSRLGGRIPRGVLLVGPPGTGKTLLAKAIAGEANVPFFSISGSDFVEMFVGVGASRVRDLFRQAREHSPCLVFLDEIDAVGRKRGSGLGGGHDEREQTLNAILVEMDGFETDSGIILVAATNRPDVLDPALLRPGRFDRQITVGLPDVKGREAILRVHTLKVKIAPDVDMTRLARATPGFSGAELAAMVNEAALIATLKNREYVLFEDFEEARDKVRWGRQKKNRAMEEKERILTAYHEAGHALVAHFIPEVEPLHKVTIIPRGMMLGGTMVLPERDRYDMKRREILGFISFAYGGRAAEEAVFDDISSGAYDDIKRATEYARNMVCKWGMSDTIGAISYAEAPDAVFLGQDLMRERSHSESMALEIDREVKRILGECHVRARSILAAHRVELEAVANALLKYETLTGAEVGAIVDGRAIDDLKREGAENERIASERRKVESERQKAEKRHRDAAQEGIGGRLPGAEPHPA